MFSKVLHNMHYCFLGGFFFILIFCDGRLVVLLILEVWHRLGFDGLAFVKNEILLFLQFFVLAEAIFGLYVHVQINIPWKDLFFFTNALHWSIFFETKAGGPWFVRFKQCFYRQKKNMLYPRVFALFWGIIIVRGLVPWKT